jgi:hypothetical protein
MRFLMIAGTAAILLLPASAPAKACGAGHTAQAASADFSAATKKKVAKKPHKKKPKEKIEYMRAAPMR